MKGQSVQQQRSFEIQSDKIQLPQGKHDVRSVVQENRFVKKQNQVLRKELESISGRLDQEIRKRVEEQKKRAWGRPEDVSHMQLQNAYKKCQIYKRQVSFYRKKLDNLGDTDRYQQCHRKAEQFSIQNQQLREQLKYLSKINKLQQKGLSQIGAQGYLKIIADNEKMQQQVRRLKKQLDQYRRASRTRTEADQNSSDNKNRQNMHQSTVVEKDGRFQQDLRRLLKNSENNGDELIDLLQQKVEKDYQKIRGLVGEKNKLRDLIQNYKQQLIEKEKEISSLKQKIANLRKNNQMLISQHNTKTQQTTVEEEYKTNPYGRTSKSKVTLTPPKRRIWKKIPNDSSQLNIVDKNDSAKLQIEKIQGIFKWTHQTLSSKIKQIQVLTHQDGHIKDIHACYQKGQPKRYDQSAGKSKYKILSCTEGEFIKSISGCFSNEYLQCLVVKTTSKRIQKYGNYQQYQNSKQGHFQFQIGDKQYPGALYGQTDEYGVRKLGCVIHKE